MQIRNLNLHLNIVTMHDKDILAHSHKPLEHCLRNDILLVQIMILVKETARDVNPVYHFRPKRRHLTLQMKVLR